MAGDNDVSRLLASIGGAPEGYHRVDTIQPSGADVQGTPLIDAVFGRDSPSRKAAAVADGIAPFMAQPSPVVALPDMPATPAPRKPEVATTDPHPVSSLFPDSRGPSPSPRLSRSLRDIREILSPSRNPEVARGSQPSGLTGLFDRLGQ